jgi:hypothetical protein
MLAQPGADLVLEVPQSRGERKIHTRQPSAGAGTAPAWAGGILACLAATLPAIEINM